jgi:hypothetical protein
MTGFAFRTPRLMVASIPSRAVSLSLSCSPAWRRFPWRKPPRRLRPAAAPAAKPDAILTPAQLQECVNRKERLQAQTDDALKDKAAIEADKAEIARSGTSLAEELTTLDRTSEDAVGAYNAKVEQRDKLIETYQGRVNAYNLKAEAVKTTQDGYDKSCGTAATTTAT